RKFQGKLVRTADAINMTTRTLLIEVDVANPAGTLLTGSYAEVHLAIPTQASSFVIPVNTLIFRTEGLRVGIVKDGKVVLAAVTPGHDFGNTIEIVAGLKADDPSHRQPARLHCFRAGGPNRSGNVAGPSRRHRSSDTRVRLHGRILSSNRACSLSAGGR